MVFVGGFVITTCSLCGACAVNADNAKLAVDGQSIANFQCGAHIQVWTKAHIPNGHCISMNKNRLCEEAL